MTVIIDLCCEDDSAAVSADLPAIEDFETWATAALDTAKASATEHVLCIRLVDDEESASLNSHYRDKAGPTNILSFPAADMPEVPGEIPLLGDLAICVPVLAREASAQGKSLQAHYAHLTVHGVLHLCGHDHEESAAAEAMEALEQQIMAHLGFPDPYA